MNSTMDVFYAEKSKKLAGAMCQGQDGDPDSRCNVLMTCCTDSNGCCWKDATLPIACLVVVVVVCVAMFVVYRLFRSKGKKKATEIEKAVDQTCIQVIHAEDVKIPGRHFEKWAGSKVSEMPLLGKDKTPNTHSMF